MSKLLGNIKPLSINSNAIQGTSLISTGGITTGGLITSTNGTAPIAITTSALTTVTNGLAAASFATPIITSTAALGITSATTCTINTTGANALSLNTVTIANGTGNTIIPGTLNITGNTTVAGLSASSASINGVLTTQGLKRNIVTTSVTPFSILSTHSIIEYKSTGASVINLPVVGSVSGHEYIISLTSDANNGAAVVITPNLVEKIEGNLSSITLSQPGDSVSLFSNGITWKII